MKKLGKGSHVHRDLLLEVVSAVHVLKDILRNIEQVVERILDGDFIASNLFDLEVCILREPLLFLELLKIPQRVTSALDLLCNRTFLASLTCGATTECCTEDEGGRSHKFF